MRKAIIFILIIVILQFSGCSSIKNRGFEDDITKIEQEISSVFHDIGSIVLYLMGESIGDNSIASAEDSAGGEGSRNEIDIDSDSKGEHVQGSESNIAAEINKYSVETGSYQEFYHVVYDSMKNFEDSIYIKIKGYDEKVYNLDMVNSILDDHYDMNYGLKGIKGTVYTMGNKVVLKIEYTYSLTKEQMVNMRDASEKKAEQIIGKIIKPNMSDLNRVHAVHNYIVNNTSYDYKNYKADKLPPEAYTDYGVLINGSAVCEGYAKAMQRLLTLAGVECITVKGNAGGVPHAWNIVKIDGKYCHVDTTWDDPVASDGRSILSYKYYNLSDSQIARDHQWDNSKYPECTTKEFNRKR